MAIKYPKKFAKFFYTSPLPISLILFWALGFLAYYIFYSIQTLSFIVSKMRSGYFHKILRNYQMLFSSPSLGYGAQAPEGWIYRVPTRHIHYLSASLVFHSPPPPYSYSSSSSYSILLLLHTHTQAGSDILAKSFADYSVATICQD